MKLTFTKDAIKDLQFLKEFIANRNQEAAKRTTKKLKQGILRLKTSPYVG